MKVKVKSDYTILTCWFTNNRTSSYFFCPFTNNLISVDESIIVDGELPEQYYFVGGKQVVQKLFDTALQHIRKQGCKSHNSDFCMYKNGELGCAAAPFIKEYQSGMNEVGGWRALCETSAFLPYLVEEAVYNKYIVYCLQHCHDHALDNGFMDEYEKEMKRMAEIFGLEYQAA